MSVERLANELIALTRAWIPALPLAGSVTMDLPLIISSLTLLPCDAASVPLSDCIPGASPTSHLLVPSPGVVFPSPKSVRHIAESHCICWLPCAGLYHAGPRKTIIISCPQVLSFLAKLTWVWSRHCWTMLYESTLIFRGFGLQNYCQGTAILCYFPYFPDRKLRHGEVKQLVNHTVRKSRVVTPIRVTPVTAGRWSLTLSFFIYEARL